MNVFVEENSLKDIGNAIREKNGEMKQYLPQEMGDAVRGLNDGGEYLEKASGFGNMFSQTIGIKNIKIKNINPNFNDISNFCSNNKEVEKIILDLVSEEEIRSGASFINCNSLKEVDFLGKEIKLKIAIALFQNCFSLESVNAILSVKGGNLISSFAGTYKLKEIRFLKNSITDTISFRSSPLLSSESIQSIIDGLATVAEPQTVSFHPDVKAKLTQEQITQITSKNWNLA